MRRVKLLAIVVAGLMLVATVASAASSPSVSTGVASKIKNASVTLNGTVNPNGATTGYRFEWGLTSSYGAMSAVKTVKGTASMKVSAIARGLLPGTVYHFRIVALNKFGGAAGADHHFKTSGNPPPDVATGPSSQVSTTSATVTGIVNPHNANTTWRFQYGLTSSYTSQTMGGSVPAGSTPVTVSEQIQGLTPGTIFHYRLVAVHSGSVPQYGSDSTFMTFPSHRPQPHVGAHTTPRHVGNRPFVFTTSGHVTGPSSIPSAFDCSGNVGVRFFLGNRVVNFNLFQLQSNCTFSGQTTFSRLPGHGKRHRLVKLRVVVHWRGNGYLAPAFARTERVSLGG